MINQMYLGGRLYTWAARPSEVYVWETLGHLLEVIFCFGTETSEICDVQDLGVGNVSSQTACHPAFFLYLQSDSIKLENICVGVGFKNNLKVPCGITRLLYHHWYATMRTYPGYTPLFSQCQQGSAPVPPWPRRGQAVTDDGRMDNLFLIKMLL